MFHIANYPTHLLNIGCTLVFLNSNFLVSPNLQAVKTPFFSNSYGNHRHFSKEYNHVIYEYMINLSGLGFQKLTMGFNRSLSQSLLKIDQI